MCGDEKRGCAVSTTAFGDFLRFYRSRVPLTQEELAERTGLSTRAISDMERGRTLSPQFRTVQLLVDGLGLFGEETAEFTALARASRVVAAQERPETPFAATSYSLPPVLIELTGRESEKALLDVFAADAASSSRLQIAVVHGAPGRRQDRARRRRGTPPRRTVRRRLRVPRPARHRHRAADPGQGRAPAAALVRSGRTPDPRRPGRQAVAVPLAAARPDGVAGAGQRGERGAGAPAARVQPRHAGAAD